MAASSSAGVWPFGPSLCVEGVLTVAWGVREDILACWRFFLFPSFSNKSGVR